MAAILFRLRGVPEDEARDIRRLLDDNGISYYETSAGNWGISLPAIWVRHTGDLDRARALIEDYQKKRVASARQAYEHELDKGTGKTFFGRFREQPLHMLLYLAVILGVLYLSTMPFVNFGGD